MKKIFVLSAILIFIGNFGCKKVYRIEGTIQGKVMQYTDEFGIQKDLEGIKVTLTNSTLDDEITTQTNSDGTYQFKSVMSGSYELIIGKSAPYHHYFDFVGGEKPYIVPLIYLSEKSTTEVHPISYVYDTNGNYFKVLCSVSPAGTPEKPRKIDLESDNFWGFSATTTSDSIIINLFKSYATSEGYVKFYGVSTGKVSSYHDSLNNYINPTKSDQVDSIFIKNN